MPPCLINLGLSCPTCETIPILAWDLLLGLRDSRLGARGLQLKMRVILAKFILSPNHPRPFFLVIARSPPIVITHLAFRCRTTIPSATELNHFPYIITRVPYLHNGLPS